MTPAAALETAPVARETSFLCTVCNVEKPANTDGITTGYGINRDGSKVCYECCAEIDKAEMVKHGTIVLYLTYDEKMVQYGDGKVSNWPASLEFKARVKKGKHNMAGNRYDVWFRDHTNRLWHGVQYGDNSQLCYCKRLKG